MSMDRRAFVKFIALLAAGAAARPEQVAAFENYYEVNTPKIATGLVSVDEICIGGVATHSIPAQLEILRAGVPYLKLGVNLFGGVVRWLAAPDQKIMVSACEFGWRINNCVPADFSGQISYIDQDGIRQMKFLDRCEGTLA